MSTHRSDTPLFDQLEETPTAVKIKRCECGCGEVVGGWRKKQRFVLGHHLRGHEQEPEHIRKKAAALRQFHETRYPDGLKQCSKCREMKSVTDFPWRKQQNCLGSICRPCETAKNLSWRKRNPEAALAAVRRSSFYMDHGIREDDYLSLHSAQEGRCAICGCIQKYKGRVRLSIDHCHNTNEIRGLLCGRCNSAIGMLRDNPATARKAAEYLEKAGTGLYSKPRRGSRGGKSDQRGRSNPTRRKPVPVIVEQEAE